MVVAAEVLLLWEELPPVAEETAEEEEEEDEEAEEEEEEELQEEVEPADGVAELLVELLLPVGLAGWKDRMATEYYNIYSKRQWENLANS